MVGESLSIGAQMTERRPEWATRLQNERETRGWNKREMARQLLSAAGHSHGSVESLARQIRGWESGAHFPRDWVAAYTIVFNLDENDLMEHRQSASLQLPTFATATDLRSEMLAVLTLAWTVGRLGQRMDRRTLLQLAATATAGAALDPTERLLRALGGDHRPDDVTVSHLEDRTRGFHRLEEHFPARLLYPALMAHLGEVSALLESGPADVLRQRLAVTVGESAVLAAWLAWELKDGIRVASMSRLTGVAAKQGNDPAIAAAWGGYRTYMTGGDSVRGVRLAGGALERLGDGTSATRAWLLARMAEEAALAGDRNTALTAISEAEEVYAAADINARPWTCFLDPARFASMSLAVYTRVRHEEKAVNAMDEILMHLGAEPETKKLCVVKADMALSRIRLGDITGGVAYARSSLAATDAMSAPLGWDRLDQVAEELRDSRAMAADEFRTEYATTRPRVASPSLP